MFKRIALALLFVFMVAWCGTAFAQPADANASFFFIPIELEEARFVCFTPDMISTLYWNEDTENIYDLLKKAPDDVHTLPVFAALKFAPPGQILVCQWFDPKKTFYVNPEDQHVVWSPFFRIFQF